MMTLAVLLGYVFVVCVLGSSCINAYLLVVYHVRTVFSLEPDHRLVLVMTI